MVKKERKKEFCEIYWNYNKETTNILRCIVIEKIKTERKKKERKAWRKRERKTEKNSCNLEGKKGRIKEERSERNEKRT